MSKNTNAGGNSKYVPEESLRQEAKECLRQATEEMGEPLSRSDYTMWYEQSDVDAISHATLTERLEVETWKAACQCAGVDAMVNSGGKSEMYTDAELQTALQQAAEEIGEPVSVSEYQSWHSTHKDQSSTPSANTIIRRIGGDDEEWCSACETAGIQPYGNPRYTVSELENELQRAAEEMGEPLSYDEYRAWKTAQDGDVIAPTTITRRLGDGNWRDACRSVGVETHGD